MENLTEYKIKLPTVPDGFELCGPCYATEDHLLFSWTAQQWVKAKQHDFGYLRHIIARRKRTLADWANEQPLFRALAEIFRSKTLLTVSKPTDGGAWILDAEFMQRQEVFLGAPPVSGKLTLKNGKWEDVP